MVVDYRDTLDKAKGVQDNTIHTLTNILGTVEETKTLGEDILAHMNVCSTGIGRMQEDVSTIETSLLRANRHVRMFTRKLATDKIIMAFMLLIVCAVAFIIVSLLCFVYFIFYIIYFILYIIFYILFNFIYLFYFILICSCSVFSLIYTTDMEDRSQIVDCKL